MQKNHRKTPMKRVVDTYLNIQATKEIMNSRETYSTTKQHNEAMIHYCCKLGAAPLSKQAAITH